MKKDEDKEGYLLRKSKLRGIEKITEKCIRITNTVTLLIVISKIV